MCPSKQIAEERAKQHLGLRVTFKELAPKRTQHHWGPTHGVVTKHCGQGTHMQHMPTAASFTSSPPSLQAATASAEAKLVKVHVALLIHSLEDVACPHCLASCSPGQYYPRDFGHLCTGSGYMLQLIALQRNPCRPRFSAPWTIGVVSTISYLLMRKIVPSCFILDVVVAEHTLRTFFRQLRREQNIHGSLSSILCCFSGLDTPWYHWDCLGHREGWVWDPMSVLSSSRVCYPAVLTEYDLGPLLPPSLSAHHLPFCTMRHLFAFGEGSEILGGVFSLLCASVYGVFGV